MNKLTIPNGGMPFEGDDLLYMQDQLRDTFKAVMRAFSPNISNFVLQGLEVTHGDGVWVINPGYVVLGYEILPFAGASVPTDNISNLALGLQVTYDPAGNEVFGDQVSKDTYEVRSATVKNFENSENELRLFDLRSRYFGSFVSNLSGMFSAFDLTLAIGISGSLKAFKFNNFVLIQGFLESIASSFYSSPVCILPLALIPPIKHKFVIPGGIVSDPLSLKIGLLDISYTGEIIVTHPERIITISGLSYYINA